MARGGGNITQVSPGPYRQHVPGPLEALAMQAPQLAQMIFQFQQLPQQRALMQAQLEAAQAQGRAATLQAGQFDAEQQANADAARALLAQGQQEMSGFRLPFPNLSGQMQPRAPQPTDGGLAPRVTPHIRQQGSQPTLSPEVAQFFADPATRAVAGMLASGQSGPGMDARLAERGADARRIQQEKRLLATFPEAQRPALGMALKLREAGIPADVISATVREVSPTRMQALDLEMTELQIQALRANQKNAAGNEAADRAATAQLVQVGLLPQGTEYHAGAADRLLQFNIARRTADLGTGGLSPVRKVILDLYRDNNQRQRVVQQPARNALGIITTNPDGTPVMEYRSIPMTATEIWNETIDAASRVLGESVVKEALGTTVPPGVVTGTGDGVASAGPIPPNTMEKARQLAIALAARGVATTEIEAQLLQGFVGDGVNSQVAAGAARSIVRERVTSRSAR